MITSCWRKLFWTGVAMILAAPMTHSCSNGGGERICDPGSTQTCVCGGGTPGGQVCSDDGTRWGDCNCAAPDATTDPDANADPGGDADVTVEVDAEDLAGCETSCGTAGATSCDGNDMLSCQTGDDGCMTWTVIQHCSDTGLVCQEDGGTAGCHEAPGNCSLSGAPCAEDADCPETMIEGFCLDYSSVSYVCVYDAWLEMPETETCGGHLMHTCYSVGDCPGLTEMSCYEIEAACGVAEHSFCYWSYNGQCTSSTSCDITGAQTCVICGNNEIDSPQEECDDGNTADGDGCSSRCQYERHCKQMVGGDTGCGCMTLDDCHELCPDWCVGFDFCDECS
jgi:cysteine-rich repeat protein